ncbi:PHP domain-containing protein [Candidatus Woesearchaeota archaeon]|nr:PHP domain-containing protein [Candidatus Woesearchaeota archaeon]
MERLTDNIEYGRPDTISLSDKGFQCVDMHFHTKYSDTFTRISLLLKRCQKMKTGIAITDHNAVGGSIEAISRKTGTMVLPGIEVSSSEGPHCLLYFNKASDLEEYYDKYIKENKRKNPYLAIYLGVHSILDAADDYNCLKIAAHPFSYSEIGLMNAIDMNYLENEVISRFDGFEAINGSHFKQANLKSSKFIEDNDMVFTAGTDGHSMFNLADSITYGLADTAEDFLEMVRKKKNNVVGRSTNIYQRFLPYGQIATNFIPYLAPTMKIKFNAYVTKPISYHYGPMIESMMYDAYKYKDKTLNKVKKTVKEIFR